MDTIKMLLITVIIILSLAVGYLKGKKKYAALIALGLMLTAYITIYLGK